MADYIGIPSVAPSVGTSHDTLTTVTSDQHHAKSHTHNGTDGSGLVSHSSLTDVSASVTEHGNVSHTTLGFPNASNPGDGTEQGSSTSVARLDHQHARENSLGSFGTRDHDLLTGLLDDDHTQYQKETDFTAGSILFRGSSVITQDNANLFWDDTNNRLGLATATPGARLEVFNGDIRSYDGTVDFRFAASAFAASQVGIGTVSNHPIRFYINSILKWGIETDGSLKGQGGHIQLTGGTLYGNSSIGGTLTLSSTNNATKGKLLFGTSSYDEVNNRLGIGTASPGNVLHVISGAAEVAKIESSNVAGPYLLWTAPSGVNPGLIGADSAVSGLGTTADFAIRSAGYIVLRAGGATERWRVTGAGHLLAGADNANDIGALDATRPKDVYVAGSVFISTGGTKGIYSNASEELTLRANTATGTIMFQTNSANIWKFSSAGHLLAVANNVYIDLSAISAGSPNFKITETTDTPAGTPAGWLEVLSGATPKYIQLYT